MADVPVAYYNTDHSQSVAVNHKWWDAKSAEMHSHQFGVIKKIRENQAYRTTNYLRFARLYSNMELKSLAGGLFAQVGNNDAQNFLANRVTFNVIKSCVDTIAAKIAKNKPRPVFLTEKGLWNMQQRAKLLSEFILATFESMGTGWNIDRTMYGMGQQCFVEGDAVG